MENVHQVCPICQSGNITRIEQFKRAYLAKCNSCVFVFSYRIPTRAELDAHYRNYNRGRYVSELTLKRYRALLNTFESFRKTGKILDVGCGSGFFLDVAKEMRWEVYGTEFGHEAVDFCVAKGHVVFEGPLENIDYEEGSFDVITSFEVIEHIIYPRQNIQKIFSLLRKGGMVYITTPNFNAITRRLLQSEWNLITYPEHLSYFTKKSINNLMISEGFLPQRVWTDGISVDRLRNSLYKKRVISENFDPKLGEKKLITNESIRQASETNKLIKALRLLADQGLDLSGTGEFLKGFYIKT